MVCTLSVSLLRCQFFNWVDFSSTIWYNRMKTILLCENAQQIVPFYVSLLITSYCVKGEYIKKNNISWWTIYNKGPYSASLLLLAWKPLSLSPEYISLLSTSIIAFKIWLGDEVYKILYIHASIHLIFYLSNCLTSVQTLSCWEYFNDIVCPIHDFIWYKMLE